MSGSQGRSPQLSDNVDVKPNKRRNPNKKRREIDDDVSTEASTKASVSQNASDKNSVKLKDSRKKSGAAKKDDSATKPPKSTSTREKDKSAKKLKEKDDTAKKSKEKDATTKKSKTKESSKKTKEDPVTKKSKDKEPSSKKTKSKPSTTKKAKEKEASAQKIKEKPPKRTQGKPDASADARDIWLEKSSKDKGTKEKESSSKKDRSSKSKSKDKPRNEKENASIADTADTADSARERNFTSIEPTKRSKSSKSKSNREAKPKDRGHPQPAQVSSEPKEGSVDAKPSKRKRRSSRHVDSVDEVVDCTGDTPHGLMDSNSVDDMSTEQFVGLVQSNEMDDEEGHKSRQRRTVHSRKPQRRTAHLRSDESADYPPGGVSPKSQDGSIEVPVGYPNSNDEVEHNHDDHTHYKDALNHDIVVNHDPIVSNTHLSSESGGDNAESDHERPRRHSSRRRRGKRGKRGRKHRERRHHYDAHHAHDPHPMLHHPPPPMLQPIDAPVHFLSEHGLSHLNAQEQYMHEQATKQEMAEHDQMRREHSRRRRSHSRPRRSHSRPRRSHRSVRKHRNRREHDSEDEAHLMPDHHHDSADLDAVHPHRDSESRRSGSVRNSGSSNGGLVEKLRTVGANVIASARGSEKIERGGGSTEADEKAVAHRGLPQGASHSHQHDDDEHEVVNTSRSVPLGYAPMPAMDGYGSGDTAPSNDDPHSEVENRPTRRKSHKRRHRNGRKRRNDVTTKLRTRQNVMSDADELDSRVSRRAQELMNKAEAPGGALGILEKFLPFRTLPSSRGAGEMAEEQGFLELPELGENESLADDMLMRDAHTGAFRVLVPEKFSYIVERMGKFKRRLDAGWHVLMPFMDRIMFVHSLKEEPMTLAAHHTFTKDGISVVVGGVLFVRVCNPVHASYAVDNPYRSLLLLAQACINNAIGKRDLRDALVARPDLGDELEEEINDQARTWGLFVSRIEISELDPPPELRAMLQMAAEERLQGDLEGRDDYGGGRMNYASLDEPLDRPTIDSTDELLRHGEESDNDGGSAKYTHSHSHMSSEDYEDSHDEKLRNQAIQQSEAVAQREAATNSETAAELTDIYVSHNSAVQLRADGSVPGTPRSDYSYEPSISENLSEQQALGSSWFTGATATSTRRAPHMPVTAKPPVPNPAQMRTQTLSPQMATGQSSKIRQSPGNPNLHTASHHAYAGMSPAQGRRQSRSPTPAYTGMSPTMRAGRSPAPMDGHAYARSSPALQASRGMQARSPANAFDSRSPATHSRSPAPANTATYAGMGSAVQAPMVMHTKQARSPMMNSAQAHNGTHYANASPSSQIQNAQAYANMSQPSYTSPSYTNTATVAYGQSTPHGTYSGSRSVSTTAVLPPNRREAGAAVAAAAAAHAASQMNGAAPGAYVITNGRHIQPGFVQIAVPVTPDGHPLVSVDGAPMTYVDATSPGYQTQNEFAGTHV